MDKSRKAFEHEMSMGGCSLGLREGHGYLDPVVDGKWQMWQASRKQAFHQAALYVEVTEPSPITDMGARFDLAQAIRSLEGNATKETT